ncbi:hypothetical protein GALMADRAFT_248908 [Galerina marginata CBS 339.88]|uniref:Uncharacterized protein n=1 Tax=Galerina marginata (strain CBS 339.88) TaxID=685588 RepID=A0A067T7T4_GALM3|nr:hypothetical protein GALMADRAFT_248908 [Galerina marginata CBS 339.88]
MLASGSALCCSCCLPSSFSYQETSTRKAAAVATMTTGSSRSYNDNNNVPAIQQRLRRCVRNSQSGAGVQWDCGQRGYRLSGRQIPRKRNIEIHDGY